MQWLPQWLLSLFVCVFVNLIEARVTWEGDSQVRNCPHQIGLWGIFLICY